MSKVEKGAEEYCYSTLVGSSYIKRMAYIQGYHQAEKDLELTLEDIKTIDKLLNQCVDYSNPYQEVLKRFKNMKDGSKR